MAITIDGNTRFEGAVLCTRERNFYDDSDWYAVVWDGEGLRPVQYATTRYPMDGSAVIDATEAVRARAAEWLADWLYALLKRRDQENAQAVVPGREVVVRKKCLLRKRPHPLAGTMGRVGWVGEVRHPAGWRATTRVRVDMADGQVLWFGIDELAVVRWQQYATDPAVLRRRAEERAAILARRDAWHLPFVDRGMVVM